MPARPRDGRRIVVYVATSADGYIARPDGSVEWLDRPHTAGDYGMAAFRRSIDAVLFGRATFDVAVGFMKQGLGGFETDVKNYVFTHRPIEDLVPGIEVVTEPVNQFARRIRATAGKDIWMMGGARLIASFLDAGEIDEFILHVMPTFIGEGIPLVAPRHRTVELSLRSSRRFSDGVVRLHYDVQRSGAAVRTRKRAARSTPPARRP